MDDDIIRMAKEAGLIREWMELCKKDEEALARFADRVRADEREACAQILDRNADVCANNSMIRDVLKGNAAAIRARGEKK